MVHTIVRLMIRWRWPACAVALLLAAPAYWISGQLSFDRSIENMFAPDDPLLAPYRRLKEIFGGNEIVLAVYADPQLRSAEGYRRVERLTGQLAEVPGVRSVMSISSTPLGAGIVRDSQASDKLLAVLQGYAVGPPRDGQYETASVVCTLEPSAPGLSPEKTIQDIRRLVQGHEIPGVIAGEPVMVVDGFRFIDRDGNTLGYTCLILLSVTILLCFRSLRWLLIPLAVIQLTLVLTQATMVLSRLKLSMVSSMLTAIVTVVAVATVIHIIVRFREARTTGASSLRALVTAGRLLAVPVVLACATDAVGFGALLWAHVGPVQDFGIMMAVGSLLVIVSVALLVPALALAGRWDIDPRRAWGERSLDIGLARLVRILLSQPKTVGLISAAVAIVVALGGRHLQVETNFTKNFRADSDVVKSYNVVESRLGGAGVLDVLVPTPDFLDDEMLDRIRRLEDRLRAEVVVHAEDGTPSAGLTKVLSLADVFDSAQPGDLVGALSTEQLVELVPVDDILDQVSHEQLVQVAADKRVLRKLDLPPALRAVARFAPLESVFQKMDRAKLVALLKAIPQGTLLRAIPQEVLNEIWLTLPVELRLGVIRDALPEMVTSLYNDRQHTLRIMLRAHERRPAEQKTQVIRQIREICNEEFPVKSGRQIEVTGFYVLLTSLVESMIRDQWICFAWAVIGIGLMMLMAFRSFKLALIAIVPNAVPILMVTGLMGWLDIKINMGAAMIAAVSMGLSIDSSIHYLTAYRRARRRGISVSGALHEVHQSVGRAMILSTLALIIGFTALCASQFVPTIYFGALVSLAMLGGLFGNLVLLPLLLMLVERRESNVQQGTLQRTLADSPRSV